MEFTVREVIYESVDTVVEAVEAELSNRIFAFTRSAKEVTYELQLKIDVPIIMLRNINQPKLCNGTRLAVKKLMSNVTEVTILT
ncbi:unnamed protein product [Onchocerca flexuosa]|uniref:ATP-dependent DNA helicase n=1 Tax=Onchocerca flexuosa TaxID=387005 RepID=A0A183HDS3_9BILA|nr:unnamed protein product [Onchocerca flexuosa]